MLNKSPTSLQLYNNFLLIFHNNINDVDQHIYNNNKPVIVDFVNHVYRLKSLFIPSATISRMLLNIYQNKLFFFINQEHQQSFVTELIGFF